MLRKTFKQSPTATAATTQHRLRRSFAQVTFAANTTETLSRWAGEVLETLGSERDRAQALHRENARVSREATMAQKEILGLEAKVFHAKKDVRTLFVCDVPIGCTRIACFCGFLQRPLPIDHGVFFVTHAGS